MPYSQEQLTEAFDLVKNKDDPTGLIDTYIEISEEELPLYKEAIEHFTSRSPMFLPNGPGRKPFTWALHVITKENLNAIHQEAAGGSEILR